MSGIDKRLDRLTALYQRRQPARRDRADVDLSFLGHLSLEEQFELDQLLSVERPLLGEGPARSWTLWERLRTEELLDKARRSGR